MKIVIAGGTGLIGRKLADFLVKKGHDVVVLTRGTERPVNNVTYVPWLLEGTRPERELRGADVFINLAGMSINYGRWTAKQQKEIYNSRMKATEELLRILEVLPEKPDVWINASAIGIYPTSVDAVYTEQSKEKADNFLGKTVADWEKRAKTAENFGVRTVFMRFGLVLDKDGGALPLMALPYKCFVGGRVGSGTQWISWVHIIDVVRAIWFAIKNIQIRGPVNVTAPNPLTMEEFGKKIASVLKRPHWLPVPDFLLKLVLGKKSMLVLEGQFVLPKVLQREGFQFLYPTADKALEDLYGTG